MNRLSRLICALLGLSLVAACSGGGDDSHSDLIGTLETGNLRIGTSFDQPGIAMMVDGEMQGMSVDVAAYIVWKLGLSPYAIEWIEAPYADRIEMLVAGELDMVIGSYSRTEERLEQIDMVGPTIIAGQDVMVRADDLSISRLEDLTGKVVCAAAATTSLERIQTLLGDSVTYAAPKTFSECMGQLLLGEVDAVSTEDFILSGYAASEHLVGKVRLLGETFSQDEYMIGLPKGSTSLCEQINAALTDMFADGSWLKFVERHVGNTGYAPNPELNPPTLYPCR